MKCFPFPLRLLSLGIASALVAGCGSSQQVPENSNVFETALLNDAELVLRIDAKGMRESPFGRAMAQRNGDLVNDLAQASIPADTQRLLGLLQLEIKDIEGFIISLANLDSLAPEAQGDIKVSGLLKVTKTVTSHQVRGVLDEALGGVEVIEEQYEGSPFFTAFLSDYDVTMAFSLINEAPNTLLYFGDEQNVRAALRRNRGDGAPDGLPFSNEAFVALEVENHAWMSATIPPAMRADLADDMASLQEIFGGGPANALASLRQVSGGMRADESLAVHLSLAFRGAEEAATVHELWTGALLPMFQMAAGLGNHGGNLSFLEKVRSTVAGANVSINATFSPDEVQQMVFLAGADAEALADSFPQEETRSGSGNQWPPLHLQQVIPREKAAVIDGVVIFEGDQVQGVTLREVASDGIILQRGSNLVFLQRGAILEPDPDLE